MGAWTDDRFPLPIDEKPEEEAGVAGSWTAKRLGKTVPQSVTQPKPTPTKPETLEDEEARLGPILHPLKQAGRSLGKFAGHMYALAGEPSRLYEEKVVQPLDVALRARPEGQEESWAAQAGRNIIGFGAGMAPYFVPGVRQAKQASDIARATRGLLPKSIRPGGVKTAAPIEAIVDVAMIALFRGGKPGAQKVGKWALRKGLPRIAKLAGLFAKAVKPGTTAYFTQQRTRQAWSEAKDRGLSDAEAAGAAIGTGLGTMGTLTAMDLAGKGIGRIQKRLKPTFKEPVRYREPLRPGGREREVKPPPLRRPKERVPYKVRFEKRPYDPLALERAVRKSARVQEEAKLETEKVYRERVQQEKLRRPRAKPPLREPVETATEPSEPGKLKLWTTRGEPVKKPTPIEPKPRPSRPGTLTLWDTGVKPKPRAGLQPAELPGRRAKDIAAYAEEKRTFPTSKIPEEWRPGVRPQTTVSLPAVPTGETSQSRSREIRTALAGIVEKGPRRLSDAEIDFLHNVKARRGAEVEGGEAARVIETLERVTPKPPEGPLPSPRVGGGISQPLKPLEPAIIKTDKKLLSRIHITRKSQKVPEDVFRSAVSEATGGRTESTKSLSSEEARFVLSRLKVEPPTGVTRRPFKPTKPGKPLRLPSKEAVAKEKAGIMQSVSEVQRHTGQKFPETPGAPRKPSLLTRMKRSALGQLFTSKQTSYETKVQQAGGKGSKTEDILVERQREGRRKSQASANTSQDVTLQEMRRNKITPKHIQQWGDRQETYRLPSGEKLKISPAEAAKIVQLGMDPEVRNGMSRWGVTFKEVGEPIRVSISDQRALATQLRTRHPDLGKFIDFTFRWMNGPGASQVSQAYEQETGRPLNISGTYANSLRDIRRLRGTKAAITSEEAQYDRAIQEITNRLGYGPKKGVTKAPPGGPRLTGFRAPGELRGIPILKERVGSKAPYRVNDLFVDFFAHRNRVANYSGKAVGLRNAQLLLNDPGFQRAMRQGFRDGEIRLADMRKHLQAFKGLDVMSKDTLDRVTSGILRRATIGTLGLKPHIIAYQPISYLNALTEIPAKHLISREALDLGLSTRKRTLAEISKFGPELRARFEGSGHLIMTPSLTPAMREQVNIAYGGKRGAIERGAMWGIRKADQATMMRIWRASKAWARADGFSGDKLLHETNRRTMRAADRTQPTWDPLTISTLQLEARISPLKKAMVLFTSQSGKNFNMAVRAIDEFAHEPKGTPGRYAKLVKGVGIPIVINATMVYGIGHGMRKVYGYSSDDKSYVDHIGGILDRTMGGWVPMGGIAADLRRMITESFGDKAKIFIEPRHNILFEAKDQAAVIIGKMIPELLQKYAKQARTGRLKDEEAYEKAIERAIPQIMRATSTWTGLPLAGPEQILRPRLKPAELKR